MRAPGAPQELPEAQIFQRRGATPQDRVPLFGNPLQGGGLTLLNCSFGGYAPPLVGRPRGSACAPQELPEAQIVQPEAQIFQRRGATPKDRVPLLVA